MHAVFCHLQIRISRFVRNNGVRGNFWKMLFEKSDPVPFHTVKDCGKEICSISAMQWLQKSCNG